MAPQLTGNHIANQEVRNRRMYNKNKAHARYIHYRSNSGTFIRKYAQQDDLNKFTKLIAKRRKHLNEM